MSFSEKNIIFLKKLRDLPDKKKKIILWTIVIILGLIMGIFWIKEATNGLSKIGENVKQIKLPEIQTPVITNITIPDQTGAPSGSWKTYTNDKYNFEIKYPSDWTFREYPDTANGAGFRPLEKPNKINYEFVNITFINRGADYCKIPFEDYVKVAGPSEIQNYESLNTIEKGVNNNGLEMYTITWNYADLQGNKKVSSPITYFETKSELCGDVEVFLNDNNYLDIYKGMISTFKFTK
jgi:hypothetical protein